MSVVVGVKEKDCVYLGADSQVSSDVKSIHATENNFKIIRIEDVGVLIAFVGAAKIINAVSVQDNLVSRKDLVDGELTYEFIVRHLVSRLHDIQIEYGFVNKDDMPYTLQFDAMIAHKEHLFIIQNTDGGVVFEIEGHGVVGSGAYEASGSLSQTAGQEPVERILAAIKTAQALDRYVDFPIVVMNTVDSKTTMIKEIASYTEKREVQSWD